MGGARSLCAPVLRHAVAAHMLEDGCDIRTRQELLGHADIRTTMISLHISNPERGGVRSPFGPFDAE